MDIRKIVKKTYSLIPFKKNIFSVLKVFYIPPEDVYRHLYFTDIFKVKVNSSKSFKIYHDGYQIENEIFWRGLEEGWEKISIGLWKQLSEISEIILDVGANTGIYTLVSKSVNPKSKVYAFEPILFTYEKLKRNIALNNFNAMSFPLALSNACGNAIVYVPDGSDLVYSVTVNRNLNCGTQKVIEQPIQTITLDAFVEREHIENIDLIKLDVETHEPEVLEGYQKYIRIHQPTLLIEILSDDVGSRVEKLVEGISYLFFNIDENKGIRRVEKITKSDYYNYLVCKVEVAKKLNLTF